MIGAEEVEPMTAELPTQGPLGEHVRAIRRELRMTQEAFAAYCGVTQPQISSWERGDDNPNRRVAWMLHERHGLPLDAYFATPSTWTEQTAPDLGLLAA